MSDKYALPTEEDFRFLEGKYAHAVSLYVATGDEYNEDTILSKIKSLFNEAVRTAHYDKDVADTLHHQLEQALIQTKIVAGKSLAVFLTTDEAKAYVLPNLLEDEGRASTCFHLKPLFRATSFAQKAYVLTLCAHEWELFLATANDRVKRTRVIKDGVSNYEESTHRDQAKGHDHVRKLIGAEGKQILLDAHVKRVTDRVANYINKVGGSAVPLIVFASKSLNMSLVDPHKLNVETLILEDGFEHWSDAELDKRVREILADWNRNEAEALVESIFEKSGAGKTITDLATLGRAAVEGAVDTLVLDYNHAVCGMFNAETGAIAFSETGDDILARIAITVRQRGGRIVAVRDGEVTNPSWNGEFVASARF